ncbi:hypothetical protein P43SY_003439 [Pythium insidiosum]|uniref:TRP C-terminal domain-containing protein n=1 Tax=Pythium insidiosum TaxID=114742 RepID=A0AAD5M034_PYTIN|nr:hypothetical protein P43SY_003439 [Pythium insidiosum]
MRSMTPTQRVAARRVAAAFVATALLMGRLGAVEVGDRDGFGLRALQARNETASNDSTALPTAIPITIVPRGDGSHSGDAPAPSSRQPSPSASPSPVTSAPLLIGKDGSQRRDDIVAPVKPPTPDEASKKDIVLFNDVTTQPPPRNRFSVENERTSPVEKPVVLEIARDSELSGSGASTPKPIKYVRGKTRISEDDGTGSAASSSSTKSPGASNRVDSPNIIGGRRRNDPINANAMSVASANVHDMVRYSGCAFAGVSVAMLVFFHFKALDSSWQWNGNSWAPNTWELVAYIGYLQQLGSISQLTLLKTPYLLWDFTDSFAWASGLIQKDWASSSSLESDASGSRRLATIVIGGIVAYADRLGIQEDQILRHCMISFGALVAVLLLCFISLVYVARRAERPDYDRGSDVMEARAKRIHVYRSRSVRVLGLLLCVWLVSLYPLSVMASFEITMQIEADTVNPGSLVIAMFAILVFSLAVLAVVIRAVWSTPETDLQGHGHLVAIWGTLCGPYSYRSRLFFFVAALAHIVSGIVVGSTDAEPGQLIGVIAIQIVYLGLVFILSPFQHAFATNATYAVGVLKVVNWALVFPFLHSIKSVSPSGRRSCAEIIIAINSIVIVAWFVRHLVIFVVYTRAHINRDDEINKSDIVAHEIQSSARDPRPQWSTRSARPLTMDRLPNESLRMPRNNVSLSRTGTLHNAQSIYSLSSMSSGAMSTSELTDDVTSAMMKKRALDRTDANNTHPSVSPAPTPTIRSTESPSLPPLDATASSLAGETQAPSRPSPPVQAAATRGSPSLRDAAHYSGVTAAGLSMALLLLFHQFAFDPRVAMAWPSMWTGVNAWELVLYASFLQHLTALSHLQLPQMPPSLHSFADVFSWSDFLIQKTQVASDLAADRANQRRLAAAADGMYAYARRIGISPSSVLINALVGVALVVAVLVLVFAVVLFVSRKKTRLEKIEDGEASLRLPRRALRVVGVMLLLWLVALYPLSLLACFELGRQEQVGDHDPTRLALAIVVLVFAIAMPLGAFATHVYRQRGDQIQRARVLAVWGVLYAESPYRRRCFFVLPALAQIALGVVLSGAVIRDARSALGAAMGIVVALIVAGIALSPYLSGVALLCFVAVGVVQLLNLGLSFAFLPSSELSSSSRQEIADVLLAVNVVVLVLWLVRHIITLVIGVKMYTRRDELPAMDPSVTTPGADLAASGLVRHSAKHDASHVESSALYMRMEPSPREAVSGSVVSSESGDDAGTIGSSNVRVVGPRISL